MQELYALKPVSEGEIDSFFMEVERITELYFKASVKEDPMLEQWIMAAILRNLPKQLTRDLALELKKATSIDDIHNSINIYILPITYPCTPPRLHPRDDNRSGAQGISKQNL